MPFDRGVYIPSTLDNHKLYKQFFKQEKELSEGLISTYPKETADKTLRRLYPFVIGVNETLSESDKLKRAKYKNYLNFMSKEEQNLIVTIQFSYYDNRNGFFAMIRDLFGWEPYTCLIFYTEENGDKRCFGAYFNEVDKIVNELNIAKSYIDFIDIKFLPKIPKEVEERDEFYYHAFPEEYLDKLIKNGLCPRSSGYSIMDRIYLTPSLHLLFELLNPKRQILKNTLNGKPKYYGRYLIRVKGEYISELFVDDKHDNSFFTTENIRPEKIEIFTRNGQWINILNINMYTPVATIQQALYMLIGKAPKMVEPLELKSGVIVEQYVPVLSPEDISNIPVDAGLSEDPIQYSGERYDEFSYFGDCKNTVDVDEMWTATEMSLVLRSSMLLAVKDILFKIKDGDRKIPKKFETIVKKLIDNGKINDTSEICSGINVREKIAFIYLTETDTHYFFDIN